MLAIIDYGAGNLQSVSKALKFIGCESEIVADPDKLTRYDMAVLPGVGAFGDAMAAMRASGMAAAVRDYIGVGKPLLGICLGMQLLFETSEEAPGVEGLGILKGGLYKIPKEDGLKVPHIGWNSLDIKKRDGIFRNTHDGAYVYFVHSYYLRAEDRSVVSAVARYGVDIDAAVQCGSLHATQFHPEKSGDAGIDMLKSFVKGE